MTLDRNSRFGSLLGNVRALLPIAIATVVFAAGVFILSHLLREVDISQVAMQVRQTPVSILAIAVLCMFGSYLGMVGYDWSALKYIGKSLPLPIIATGGFLGYAIGNTVGGGPLTGGAVRYRIYSALGLSVSEIATISVFGSVSFSLGMLVIGCGALALYPGALAPVTQIDPAIIRGVATLILLLCLLALTVLTVRRSEITVRQIRIRAPSLSILMGQVGFVALDFLLAGVTLYVLLPSSDLGFVPFLAVFMIAILAGVASHIPGGVGVFEAVVIAALPATVPLEQAAAGLLLYRVIYYVLPFALALVVLAINEIRMARSGALSATFQSFSPVFSALSATVPLAMSVMVFGAGAYSLVAPLIPSTSRLARSFDHVLPLGLVEAGALVSSLIGAALVVIAHGLLRRIEGAWVLTLVLLAVGVVASLARGIDYQAAIILGLVFVILLPMRAQFRRTTRLTRDVLSLRWFLMLTSLVIALFAMLFFAHKATPYAHELWWQFAADQSAPRALRATFVGIVSLAMITLLMALRPGSFAHDPATPEMLDKARTIIRAQGNPDANIALAGDKSLLLSDSGNAFLMYRIQGRTWVALHEPFGDPKELVGLAWQFYDAAYAANARPAFYSVSAASVPVWLELGLKLHKMGEAAVVSLEEFGLEGPKRKKLRTAHNRAQRDGLSFEIIDAPVSADLMATLEDISDEWLGSKSGGEKGFSVGTFDADLLAQAPIATVSYEGRIVAFANLWLTDRKDGATIDLMRHISDAPAGLMEYLFTELMLYFKSQGYREFSLGNAPLAGLEGRRSKNLSTLLGSFVYRHGRQFYNFEGLRLFKNKFSPEWHPVYIALPHNANVLAVAKDVAALIGGGLSKTLKSRKG